MLAFVLLAMTAMIAAPVAVDVLVNLDATVGRLLAALRWPILLLVMMGALSMLYRFGASREQPRWRWVTVGGLVAALGWLIASLLFSWYVGAFAHYDLTYGSIGAVMGFMTWMWLTATVILLGAELNAEVEHQTAVDSTTGAPRVMGLRGARMADTLGSLFRGRRPEAAGGLRLRRAYAPGKAPGPEGGDGSSRQRPGLRPRPQRRSGRPRREPATRSAPGSARRRPRARRTPPR